jgi:hypothetical protein
MGTCRLMLCLAFIGYEPCSLVNEEQNYLLDNSGPPGDCPTGLSNPYLGLWWLLTTSLGMTLTYPNITKASILFFFGQEASNKKLIYITVNHKLYILHLLSSWLPLCTLDPRVLVPKALRLVSLVLILSSLPSPQWPPFRRLSQPSPSAKLT